MTKPRSTDPRLLRHPSQARWTPPASRADHQVAIAGQERPSHPSGAARYGDHRRLQAKYAELHAHSAFSFLDGASQPADLAYRAAELGLSAMALTDHDGLYGAVQFATAAREVGLPTVFGSELTLGAGPEAVGADDPPGTHLLVLARGPTGYKRLSRSIAEAYLAVGEKGPPRYNLEDLAALGRGEWLVATGCRKGAVRQALAAGGPRAGAQELARLVALFGRDNVAVEITASGDPADPARNAALAELASAARVPLIATGNVHYARVREFPLASAMA
ncbi:MAG: PHP domain-containing protein, partial [Bifidobacteriaceae bacterium]|nr:PHP domain-containing protein [Bifidobacteriaceae bacterium]